MGSDGDGRAGEKKKNKTEAKVAGRHQVRLVG